MPTANVDIVRRAMAANRSGPPEDTVEAAVALAHPDIEVASRVSAVEGGTYRGHAGIRRYYSDFAEVFDEWSNDLDQVEELGPDVVLVEMEFRAVGKGSGLPAALRTVAIFALSGGKVIRVDTYGSREEALAAAGFEG